MAIFNWRHFSNRYTAGQEAVERSDWRMAYDCFMDCLVFLRTNNGNYKDIVNLEHIVESVHNMFD